MWLASWFLVQTFLGAKQAAQIYDAKPTRTHTCVFHFSNLIELYNVKNLLIQMALETDIQPGSEARGGEGDQRRGGARGGNCPPWPSSQTPLAAWGPRGPWPLQNFERNLK